MGEPALQSAVSRRRSLGNSSHESYSTRTLAAKCLDMIRCSVTVNTPQAAVILLERFFKPLNMLENKLMMVSLKNRYSNQSSTLQGYRNMELNLLYDGGLRSSRCGRPDRSIRAVIIGEVQIILEDFIKVRKRRHLIYKAMRGEFEWAHHEKVVVVDEKSLLGED